MAAVVAEFARLEEVIAGDVTGGKTRVPDLVRSALWIGLFMMMVVVVDVVVLLGFAGIVHGKQFLQ